MSGKNHLFARGENGSDVPRREAASFNHSLQPTGWARWVWWYHSWVWVPSPWLSLSLAAEPDRYAIHAAGSEDD